MKGDDQTLDLFAPPPGATAPEKRSEASPKAPPTDPPEGPAERGAGAATVATVAPEPGENVVVLNPPEEPERSVRSEPRVWTVSEVNRSVKEMLEDFLPPVWIGGEVANWTSHRSGHRYFTLKDEQAQIRCVMWRSDVRRLPIDPEDGMNVRAFGGLTLYEARGEYQLVVRELEARDADGLWRLAFEKLRKKLDGEGLLDPRRKRPIPRFPVTVGIVTSATGAALSDILTVIRRRAPWTRVVVCACRVQGDGAAAEVAAAIRRLAASGRVEVMIVGRGGGSIEDLWAFNEEVVARAIADCPLPVISAVGHEVDVTIADLVADLRAPTPSAAGEAAVPDGVALRQTMASLPTRLGRALRGAVERRGRRFTDAEGRLERAISGRVAPLAGRAERGAGRLRAALGMRVERRRQALRVAAGRLDALSPLATLRRGYAVAEDEGGRVLRRTADFSPGSVFALRVTDGRVSCATVDVEAP